jgi:hypothetical protein
MAAIRKPVGPVDGIPAVDANDRAVAPNEHSVAVVLDFVADLLASCPGGRFEA